MDPTDKNTKHIKDLTTGTEEYFEYTKENEKKQGKTTRSAEQGRRTKNRDLRIIQSQKTT